MIKLLDMASRQIEMDISSDISETKAFLNQYDSDEERRMSNLRSRSIERAEFCQSQAATAHCLRTTLLCIFVFLTGILVGVVVPYVVLACSNARSRYGGLIPPSGSISQVWEHNLTFSQSPTPDSEAAWTSLVPIGRGFIHQPDIAPFISNIAAFHQLHCLHAIMVAYYAALNSTSGPEHLMDLFGTRIAVPHVRHCFDYLRRSIMCAADTNLEVVDRVNHTTNGWGQQKICRNWDEVFQYAERYANSTDKDIVT